MLSNTHMHEELEKAENIDFKDDASYRKTVVKLLTLQIKLLHNVRTNQTLYMRFKGVDLRKPKDEEKDGDR